MILNEFDILGNQIVHCRLTETEAELLECSGEMRYSILGVVNEMKRKSTIKFPFSGPPSNGDLPPCYPKKHEQPKLCSSCHELYAGYDEVVYTFQMFQ